MAFTMVIKFNANIIFGFVLVWDFVIYAESGLIERCERRQIDNHTCTAEVTLGGRVLQTTWKSLPEQARLYRVLATQNELGKTA